MLPVRVSVSQVGGIAPLPRHPLGEGEGRERGKTQLKGVRLQEVHRGCSNKGFCRCSDLTSLQKLLPGGGRGSRTALLALPQHEDTVAGEGPPKTPFIGEVLPAGGSLRCPLRTVPRLGVLPELAGKQSRQKEQSRSPLPSSSRPRSHLAFLERGVGFLPGWGACRAGSGAVPYHSCSRTSPWQMCSERELQTVEG